MKRHINLFAVVLFALWLASFVASVKLGHGHSGYGFSSGG
jgi:hypothetical protein